MNREYLCSFELQDSFIKAPSNSTREASSPALESNQRQGSDLRILDRPLEPTSSLSDCLKAQAAAQTRLTTGTPMADSPKSRKRSAVDILPDAWHTGASRGGRLASLGARVPGSKSWIVSASGCLMLVVFLYIRRQEVHHAATTGPQTGRPAVMAQPQTSMKINLVPETSLLHEGAGDGAGISGAGIGVGSGVGVGSGMQSGVGVDGGKAPAVAPGSAKVAQMQFLQ